MNEKAKHLETLLEASMSHQEMNKLLRCHRVQLRLVGKDLQSVIPSLLSEFGIKRLQVELKAKGVRDSKVLMILELIWANLMLKKPKGSGGSRSR